MPVAHQFPLQIYVAITIMNHQSSMFQESPQRFNVINKVEKIISVTFFFKMRSVIFPLKKQMWKTPWCLRLCLNSDFFCKMIYNIQSIDNGREWLSHRSQQLQLYSGNINCIRLVCGGDQPHIMDEAVKTLSDIYPCADLFLLISKLQCCWSGHL